VRIVSVGVDVFCFDYCAPVVNADSLGDIEQRGFAEEDAWIDEHAGSYEQPRIWVHET
jgi:hypothetical protein